MNRRLIYRLGVVLVMMTTGLSCLWGADKTITLTYSSFSLTNSSYAKKNATVNGYTFTVDQGYKGTGDVIQMNKNKGNGILYNTTPITGLKSIKVNVASGDKEYTITTGTSQKPTTNSQTGTNTKTFNAKNGDTYFQLKVSGASYFSSIVITYDESGGSGGGECTASGATFTMGTDIKCSTMTEPFTNAVTYTNENTSTKQWTSDSPTVASVNSSTGKVTVGEMGTATITMKQAADTRNNVCAVEISFTVTVRKPTVEVVGVTADDKLLIDYDLDNNSQIVLSELKEGIDGNIAEDIFISKYYEAASHMKLFGIYNGTKKYIDLKKLRIRSNIGKAAWSAKKGDLNYVEFKDISKLGKDFKEWLLPPCTELIFWSNHKLNSNNSSDIDNNNKDLRNCISMNINGVAYKYDDLEKGAVPKWYCVGGYKTYNSKDDDGNNQFVFNGDDGLILERTDDDGATWYAIDILGAGTSAAPAYPESSSSSPTTSDNGKILQDKTKYNINGSLVQLNDGAGFWAKTSATIPLSTNRYYLTRKKEVLSGANAVASNKTKFVTLATEWNGTPVGAGSSANCYSGKMFSDVGQYDFASFYSTYEDISSVNDNAHNFVQESDGLWSINIGDLDPYSCHILRVDITEKGNRDAVKAQIDYSVPIIVRGHQNTADYIFTDHTAEQCASCNVVILDNAVLKVASGTNQVHDLEIYSGGKLVIPSGTELSVNQLIMRSTNDEVSRLSDRGTFNRTNADIYFDKRVTGDRWYWFTLPFDCDMADICQRNAESPTLVYGTDYSIMYYDGATRATGIQEGNWKQFEGPTLKAGIGYILGVTPRSGHNFLELRFPMKNADLDGPSRSNIFIPVKAYGAGTDIRPNHKGWNLIGNPYLDDYDTPDPLPTGKLEEETLNGNPTGQWQLNTDDGKSLRYVVVPAEDGYGEYQHVVIGTKDLEPFLSYFVQVDGNTDGEERHIEFKDGYQPAVLIRSKAAAKEEEAVAWVGVTLSDSYQQSDQTTLLIGNNFTDEYDMMDDLVKWRGTHYLQYGKPVLASHNNEGEMAFNALPETSAKAGVPLNFFAPQQGTYRFSVSDEYDLSRIDHVLLYDSRLQTSTDLLWQDYEFETGRTDDQSRFSLSVTLKKTPSVTTGMEDAANACISMTSRDGQLLLTGLPDQVDVWIYTADGKLIYRESGCNRTLRVSVPQNTCCYVRIESATGSQTLKTISNF